MYVEYPLMILGGTGGLVVQDLPGLMTESSWVQVPLVAGHVFLSMELYSAVFKKMRWRFSPSFRGDVKLSVPGDLSQLASGYSRPVLATTMEVNPKSATKTTNLLKLLSAEHILVITLSPLTVSLLSDSSSPSCSFPVCPYSVIPMALFWACVTKTRQCNTYTHSQTPGYKQWKLCMHTCSLHSIQTDWHAIRDKLTMYIEWTNVGLIFQNLHVTLCQWEEKCLYMCIRTGLEVADGLTTLYGYLHNVDNQPTVLNHFLYIWPETSLLQISQGHRRWGSSGCDSLSLYKAK